ncbi:MAG TPA: phosphoribosylglycinamide formyltransferase [Armatimonadota bacterium]|nr:phosphoribosylglycinamide formyltransferase [Armatimonadota bacterium]
MPDKLKVGVLASGGGTNLQAIIDRAADGRLEAVVAVVISNVKEAFALERARMAGIPAAFINPRDFADRAAFDRAVIGKLRDHGVELAALAGYMRITSDELVDAFAGRIMNIHPSLIPAFCGKGMHGLRVHQAALEAGVKVSGCTVHFVTKEVDAGPIIIQRCVPVLDDDTPETLSARVLEQEHAAYSEAIQLFAEGRLRVEGRRVRVLAA